jgi:hypothetical protein
MAHIATLHAIPTGVVLNKDNDHPNNTGDCPSGAGKAHTRLWYATIGALRCYHAWR